MLIWFILHTNPGHCFRNEDIASTVWARISSSYYVLNHQFVWCEIINLWTVCRSRLDWRSTITDKIKSHVVYSIAMYYKHTNLKYKGNLIKPNFEQPMLWTRISSPNSRSGRISVRDERQESDGEAKLCVVVKLFDAEWLLSDLYTWCRRLNKRLFDTCIWNISCTSIRKTIHISCLFKVPFCERLAPQGFTRLLLPSRAMSWPLVGGCGRSKIDCDCCYFHIPSRYKIFVGCQERTTSV